jgi:hypothetical protein
VPFISGSSPCAGGGEGLAGESAAEHIDLASPLVPGEGAHVRGDGKAFEGSVCLSGTQYLLAVSVDLNCTDATVSEEHPTEDATAGAGEEMQFFHWGRAP